MLTTSYSMPVIGVDVSMTIDGTHSFAITAYGSASEVPPTGDTVTIYRSGTAIMVGKVTATSYSSDGKITISGQDVSSYWATHTSVDNVTSSETTLSNLATVSAVISDKISAPSVACYGFGSYSGTIDSYVARIANSFGLHYLYNPLTQGVTLSTDVVEPSGGTAVPTLAYEAGNSYDNGISTIYLQKTVEIPEGTSQTITNGSATTTVTGPIHNSVSGSGSAYPVDVFIDPGSWEQVRMHSNQVMTTYQGKIEIGNCVKVRIDSWSDTESTPRWRLFLYNGATFLHDWVDTGETAAWESSGTPATHAIIARYKADTTPAEIEYPDFAYLTCYVTTWEAAPTNLTGWEHSASSGDTGREDTNVIDEPMYPGSYASLDGTRIAKRDSNPNSTSITVPGTDTGTLALPETTYVNLSTATSEWAKVQVPLVGLTMSDNGNNSQSQLVGEW